jgi:c-di-GMP-binding flagellar brake protein YcgR
MEEMRKYKRIYFSSDGYLTARYSWTGDSVYFDATVLNLSAGGLGMLLSKLGNARPRTGDLLVMNSIEHSSGRLASLVGTLAKVIWVAHLDELQTIGFGCEFVNLPLAVRANLQSYISDWEKGHG